jgi:16S rRNA processing protein RimM
MTVPEQDAQWVWLARIRRPQGRKGEVFADILTDFPEKFAERRRLWLLAEAAPAVSQHSATNSVKASSAPRQVELIAQWLHKGGVVLHFSGVDSISAAEPLNGLIVAVPWAERAPLEDGEVYVADLIGCTLFDVAKLDLAKLNDAKLDDAKFDEPVPVGLIEDVDRTAGPVALLVVRGATGEVLVPFAKSYLRTLDFSAKRIEMALPEGLTGLNAPEKS